MLYNATILIVLLLGVIEVQSQQYGAFSDNKLIDTYGSGHWKGRFHNSSTPTTGLGDTETEVTETKTAECSTSAQEVSPTSSARCRIAAQSSDVSTDTGSHSIATQSVQSASSTNTAQQTSILSQATASALQTTAAESTQTATTSSTAEEAGPTSLTDFTSPVKGDTWQEAVLSSHNYWRAAHGAKPAKYDDALAAAVVAIKGNCTNGDVAVTYGFAGSTGSNWAAGSGNGGGKLSPSSAASMVDMWYSEYKFIPASAWTASKEELDATLTGQGAKLGGEIGHFTQLVWNDSVTIGCAFCDTCSGGYASQLTCGYQAVGNLGIGGSYNYAANVFPRKS